MLSTVLDVAGVLLLASCAFLVFPPAALAVVGVACLVASWRVER